MEKRPLFLDVIFRMKKDDLPSAASIQDVISGTGILDS
jgi:hypothetical protein